MTAAHLDGLMALANLTDLDPDEMDVMMDQVRDAAGFLKALAHEGRLMMLCHLVSGEKTVTEFETLLSMRQPAVSQQLMRLRSDGLVTARRDGKAIYYAISDPRVKQVVSALHDMFCPDDEAT